MTKPSARTSQRIKNRAAEGLQDLLESAEDLLESLQDEHGETVEDLRAKVSSTVKAASSQLEFLRDSASGIGRQAARSGIDFVRRDPWRTVAIAAVMVLGFTFLMGRSDD